MHVVHGIDSRGFTLLELLVAMAVAAVLLGVAIPSYRGIVQRNTITASANDLLGALNYARSQAVTRGEFVSVCQSADQLNCDAGPSNWSRGWIIYAPAPGSDKATKNNRLRVKSAFDGQIRITGNGNIATKAGFDANGFAQQADGSLGNGTFTVTGNDGSIGTDVVIAPTGRIHSEPSMAQGS